MADMMTLFGDQLERDPVTTISFVVNVVGGAFALTFGALWRRAVARREKVERERDEQARQFAADRAQFKSVVRDKLLDWGEVSIGVLAEGHAWLARRAEGRQTDEREQTALQARISALIDNGRLYFPNSSADVDWPSFRTRPQAMKGFRDPILDAMMIVHEELRLSSPSAAPENAKAAADNAFAARRAFISELQDWVDTASLGFGRFHLPPPKEEKTEQDWVSVVPLVDAFEARYGAGSFWRERPMPRSALLAKLKAQNAAGR